jgi:DNA recombination protein RmuC
MTSTVLFLLGGLVGLLIGALGAMVFSSRERGRLASEAARHQAERDAALRAAEEQRTWSREGLTQLREAFGALAGEALRHNRQDFLQNADALFSPVKSALTEVRAHLAEVDKAREGSYQAIKTQLGTVARAEELLRTTTEGLAKALKSSTTRGRWGEIQLRRVIEAAGMLEQCDFVEKESVITEDGARQTPDIIIKLPGGASIVIDAKVPIDAYLAAAETESDTVRRDRLAAHARQLRDHVKSLGAKDYWKQFQPAPEFVVMFLPLEPLLAAAFEQDGALLDQAAAMRVIPATPMTLLALLMAVASGWKQQRLAENAEEIRRVGRDLYERLATMFEHLEDVRRGIKQTADSYDRFLGSLEQKVEPAARRFKEMGVSATKEIEVPDQLALGLRQLSKPELRVVKSDPDDRDQTNVAAGL